MTYNKRFRATVIALLIINLAITSLIVAYFYIPMRNWPPDRGILSFEESEQYILYIGLNDKNTYKQIIPTEQAKKIINGICTKYTGGYTVDEAQGGWVDAKGNLTEENTLIYTFNGTAEEKIINIMDEVLIALNQNSILIEKYNSTYSFYSEKENEEYYD